jgi:hypothetical protein
MRLASPVHPIRELPRLHTPMGDIEDLYASLREATRPRAIVRTAKGLARLGLSWARPPTRVEVGVQQWRLQHPEHETRWRSRGDNFEAVGGRKIAHGRRAGSIARSMTSIRAFRAFCLPELQRLGPRGPTSFLEFGACCGTTSLSVMEEFPDCRIIAFEPMRDRTAVFDELRRALPIGGRITWIEDILEHHLEGVRAMFPDGLSAIYMDTNHKYPNDLWYLEHLLVDAPLLAEDGLFICDDRMHSGTRRSVSEFLRLHGRAFDYHLVAGRWAMLRPRRAYRPAHWDRGTAPP